jgi:Na+/H+-dicarboxylate symporter
VFLIQLYGGLPGAEIQLGAVTTLIIFVTAVLAAVGAAAVPSAGLVTMVLVAQAVGLDPKYIARSRG